MGYMKARWTMACECCKAPIRVGSTFVMHAGRPWKPEHLTVYKRSRKVAASL
jgi:hypothetical protein